MMTIASRARVGAATTVLLGVLFAAALVPIATIEHHLGLTAELAPGARAAITVRYPEQGVRVVVARGEIVDAAGAALVNEVHARQAKGAVLHGGLAVVFGLVGLLLSAYMRTSHRGRLLRVQATVLGCIALLAAAAKAVLLLTPLSWFLVPTAAFSVLAVVLVDRHAGFGVAAALGLITATLLPFDASVAIVLGAQALGGVLAFSAPKRRRAFLAAGLGAAGAAAAAYLATAYLDGQHFDAAALVDPARSSLLAACVAGLVSGPVALVLRAFVERLGGEIPRSRLVELADLENPLLKKIAAEAPGTWQHSLAMANLSEIAANAIGANALLCRVGAYYHDLGKSLQPQYYIENLASGQTSPHDALPPETSADAIFAHVTEGVRVARAAGLPEPVIDFMHMHHGDGLLEYFWAKCQEQGNPKQLTPAAFRYPGVKPQSRETAILAICDALEAASRTLRKSDARAVEQLVQRIVYGKLHLGQLDESGLTVAELKKLANTLVVTLKHANHGRIEYPWQKEERAAAAAASEPPVPPRLASASPQPGRLETSGRFVLDSADSEDRRTVTAELPAPTQVVPLVRRKPPADSST
jgi:putative nucleotidyltransferase with HDIG domain